MADWSKSKQWIFNNFSLSLNDAIPILLIQFARGGGGLHSKVEILLTFFVPKCLPVFLIHSWTTHRPSCLHSAADGLGILYCSGFYFFIFCRLRVSVYSVHLHHFNLLSSVNKSSQKGKLNAIVCIFVSIFFCLGHFNDALEYVCTAEKSPYKRHLDAV